MKDRADFINMNQMDTIYRVSTNPTSGGVGAQRAAPLRKTPSAGFPKLATGFQPMARMQRYLYLALFLFVMMMLLAPVASAQDTTQPIPVVTEDEVNAIAKDLFCPVCENIPLDTCGTAACADWRYEIRLQLEDGKTRQEIVDDFVMRFGDRVVGTPQDPTLRALALFTPWVLVLIGLGVAGWTFINWRRNHYRTEAASEPVTAVPAAKDDYRAILEQDLAG